jgi:hypothetical protein
VTTPRKLLHSILFAALVFRLLTRTSNLAGSSVLTPPGLHLSQFLDKFVQGEGVISKPSHRLVDQASVFVSPGSMVVHLHLGHRVSMLVAYCDTRN